MRIYEVFCDVAHTNADRFAQHDHTQNLLTYAARVHVTMLEEWPEHAVHICYTQRGSNLTKHD